MGAPCILESLLVFHIQLRCFIPFLCLLDVEFENPRACSSALQPSPHAALYPPLLLAFPLSSFGPPEMAASPTTPAEALSFSPSWIKYPDRQSIAGSASRNVPILVSELSPLIRPGCHILEIAAGHGLLTASLAKECSSVKDVRWEAREADEELVRKIGEQCASMGVENVEARAWDVHDQYEGRGNFDLVIIANLLHIVPYATVERLFEKLGSSLVKKEKGAKVCIYGAFNEEGGFTSEGNEKVRHGRKEDQDRPSHDADRSTPSALQFDGILKARNPAYGLRDLESQIVPLAKANGLDLGEVRRLAAGNVSHSGDASRWTLQLNPYSLLLVVFAAPPDLGA